MKYIWIEEVHFGFWWGKLKKRDNLEDTGVDRLKDNIKMDPGKIEWDSWIGLFYLRIGIGGVCSKR
jgi:hypothetical protein